MDTALRLCRRRSGAGAHTRDGRRVVCRRPTNRAALVANMRQRQQKARAGDAGVTLVLEPINARDRPKWFLRSTGRSARHSSPTSARPAVKLLFDVYHVQILEGDLTRRLESCIDAVGHVQIAGVPLRHEPDEGELNIHAILATLDRLGYDGFVGCEYNPSERHALKGLDGPQRYGVVPALAPRVSLR